MIKKGVANEVILHLIVAANEDDGQNPMFLRSIAVGWATGPLVREIARGVIPSPEMPMESKLDLLWKVTQDRINAYFDGFFAVI